MKVSPTLLFFSAAAFGTNLTSRAASAPITPEARDFFENKIRPVLAAECYECHNAKKTKGGLRLDYRGGWQKGGDTGDAIVPGEPKKSLLIDSIKHTDPDLKMPEKAPKLDDAIIADFEKWIAMGAPDPRDDPPSEQASKPTWTDLLATRRGWWSIQPVKKTATPAVRNGTWSENPIDRFLLAKMEAKGLTPAVPADPHTFIRRLTFALTGLPPTPQEIEAFAAESISNRQSAISNATDRLLASPQFGEHWGRHWLDLMRYAETHGSEGDPEIREAWRYRDYVIRALNADVPLDQFIREHIAGDLLPKQRMNVDGFSESILGTANLRLVEHGFQPIDTLDDQVKAIDNQIDVITKAFQGLTVSCARCHDHKFDAVSERDYYALYGVFASVRPAQVTIDSPELQAKNRAALEKLHGEIKTALADAWLPTAEKLGDLLLNETKRADEARRIVTEIETTEKQIADLEWTARRRLHAATAEAAPAKATVAPVAVWTFDRDGRDALGRLDGTLEGGAEIRDGRVKLNGTGAYVRTGELPFTLTAKTLEAWVSLGTLDQRGGGVIAIETTREHGFDAIVFAEKDARQWVPGSNHFKRSERLNAPEETTQPGDLVHVATTYAADGTVTFYRNGQRYGASYAKPPLLEFPAQAARVLLGLRHKGAGNGFLAGAIEEARLYDRALTAEEVAASFRAGTPPVVSPEQITAALTPEQRAQRNELAKRLRELKTRTAPQAVVGERWIAALKDAEVNSANPFHLWVKTGSLPRERFGDEWTRLTTELTARRQEARGFNAENYRTMWDLAGDDYAKWFRYGNGLPTQPSAAGEFAIEPEGEHVVEGILPAGIATHRLSDKHNALLTSPRFKIDSDSISVRASGAGGSMIRVIVDNYPLPSNPIYPKAVFEKEQTNWVRVDTAYRKGSWAYIEFGTRDDLTRPITPGKTKARPTNTPFRSHFAVSEIVAHKSSEPPRELPLATLELLDSPTPNDPVELARRFSTTAAAVVRAWRDGKLNESQVALFDFLVRNGALPTTLAELPKVAPLVAEYRRLEAEVPVLRRAPGVLETVGFDAPLLPRGDHTKPGNPVPRSYLEIFGSQPYRSALSGRLELAEEIATSKNPLTTRVMANRVWHWMFGRGIVPTVDNLGRLGEKATHPELLDYLAARLVENGWSIKALIRDIAAARAFQMSSDASPRAAEIDPANELLSHFRVQRLPAEAIRDSLIAVTGKLSEEMFGVPAGDADLRRSIYLAVRRNGLNAFLQAFDAPRPFTTLGRRDATNVPGQSLTMLNSPFVISQAEHWARRLVHDGSNRPEERVCTMFVTAFARPASGAEVQAAGKYLAALAADRSVTADQLLTSELVWQDFAQSLFNLKEFIYVR